MTIKRSSNKFICQCGNGFVFEREVIVGPKKVDKLLR